MFAVWEPWSWHLVLGWGPFPSTPSYLFSCLNASPWHPGLASEMLQSFYSAHTVPGFRAIGREAKGKLEMASYQAWALLWPTDASAPSVCPELLVFLSPVWNGLG